MKTCSLCKSPRLRAVSLDLERAFDGRRVTGKVPAEKCDGCGEEFLRAADVTRFELAIAMTLARSGARSGDALAFMRRALGLPVHELAALLEVEPEVIAGWEGGGEAEHPAISALAAMVLYRGMLRTERLRALARYAGRTDRPRQTGSD